MSRNSEKSRAEFEAWITAPPFERCIDRYPEGPDKYAWPGAYEDLCTDLAWQAWQEARKLK